MEDEWFEFDPVELFLEPLPVEGPILDIGGGGEGVIGRLHGQDVIAMDIRKNELDEAPDGPQKLVMDAKALGFKDVGFPAATALFSLMYIYKHEDQVRVFQELGRVVRPGGHLYIWDVAFGGKNPPGKPYFVAFLRFHVGGQEWGTGYGMRFPDEIRDEAYYADLASEAGFQPVRSERDQHIFMLEFIKS
ncbi:MAG: methyltransferase domain-containing protein [Anaerolineaceae bacterium]|nr:methyltransferase domain-containing protein [Anaerolineaceae bacterium]